MHRRCARSMQEQRREISNALLLKNRSTMVQAPTSAPTMAPRTRMMVMTTMINIHLKSQSGLKLTAVHLVEVNAVAIQHYMPLFKIIMDIIIGLIIMSMLKTLSTRINMMRMKKKENTYFQHQVKMKLMNSMASNRKILLLLLLISKANAETMMKHFSKNLMMMRRHDLLSCEVVDSQVSLYATFIAEVVEKILESSKQDNMECDFDDETSEVSCKWCKRGHGHDQSCLNQYTGKEKTCVGAAIIQYKVYLCMQSPFGSMTDETDLANKAWDYTCKTLILNEKIDESICQVVSILNYFLFHKLIFSTLRS